jgi:hypothetical protein
MKKNYFLALGALALAYTLQSCDAFGAAMQQATVGMGGVCEHWSSSSLMYNSETGEYDLDKYRIVDTEGNNVDSYESNWLQQQEEYYGNNGNLGLFYVTSPYTEASYQINVYCEQWQQQQQQYNYGY